MKKILIIICLLLALCGCTNNQNNTNLSKEEKLSKIIQKNNYIIIDVRTKEEYKEGHVVDAINIPYDEINKNIKLDKDKTIVVYCKSGNRSKIAFNTLSDLGYEVFDLGAYDSISLEKTN